MLTTGRRSVDEGSRRSGSRTCNPLDARPYASANDAAPRHATRVNIMRDSQAYDTRVPFGKRLDESAPLTHPDAVHHLKQRTGADDQ